MSRGGLVWGDALHLDGDIAPIMDDPACFAGAAGATLILAPPAAIRGGCGGARAVNPAHRRAAGWGDRDWRADIARWLGADAALLRRAFADLACHLRQAAMGLPARLPRLWHV